MTDTTKPFTDAELDQLWATFGGDPRFDPLQYSPAMRLAAYENARRVFSEVRRLRAGGWIGAAAREIACDPQCCDVSSSNATAMADIIRKHLRGVE